MLMVLVSALIVLSTGNTTLAKEAHTVDKKIFLTNLNHINITIESIKDLKELKRLICLRNPKAIYIEQWILEEPGNKNLIKKLQKIAKKTSCKFYLVVGRSSWFGRRGVINTIDNLNKYGKYIDGIVLRVEPNKVNVWKDDIGVQAQILNQMLDAYSAIYHETKKRDKAFIAEFPFWLSDYKGPLKSFSQNVCDYTDKIIFLIDDLEKLEKLDMWNNVTCMYNINLTKRASGQTEESIHETFKKLKTKLTFYSNFNGFIIDSNSTLEDSDT